MADEQLVIEEVTEEVPPAPPVSQTPAPDDDVARLREENARLRGENAALREPPRRDPPPPAVPVPPADPIQAEYEKIQKEFAAGSFGEDERIFRISKLGTKAELAQRDRDQLEAEAREQDAQAKLRSSQKIGVYLTKIPGLANASGPEMQKVLPHLRAVVEEFGFPADDPRAQVLACERAFGPLDRSPIVDTHEFERRRHPGGGGGGGTFADEPTPPAKPKPRGEQIFDRLLPEYQTFFIITRGSKEAAIKTLEYADEHQMRTQGRFR